MAPDMVWIEVEANTSDDGVRTFRGRAEQADVERMISGQGLEFLRMLDCYWATDPVQESGAEGFHRLGHGAFSNFTGEMYVRCSTIVNVALLKAGFEGE